MPTPSHRAAAIVDALCALTLQSRRDLAKDPASRELLRGLLRDAAPTLGAPATALERAALSLCRRTERPRRRRSSDHASLAAGLPRGARDSALETCRRILRRLAKEVSR